MGTSAYEVKGIIEVGSRGIRVLVAELRDGSVHYVFSTGKQINLGYCDEVLPSSLEKIEQAVDLVLEFKRILKTFAASEMIIATEVLRNSQILHSFVSLLKEKIGASNSVPPIVVLDKKIEAYYSFTSVIKHFKRDFRMPTLVIDVGGGSTEFAVGKSTNRTPELLFTHSDKEISTLKFYKKFQKSPDKSSTWREIQQFLTSKVIEKLEQFKEHRIVELIVMGASAIDLSRLQIELSTGEEWTSSSTGLTEIEITSKFLQRLIRTDLDENIDERDFRMQFGMFLFLKTLQNLDLSVLSVCGHGLRYGIIQDWLLGKFSPV